MGDWPLPSFLDHICISQGGLTAHACQVAFSFLFFFFFNRGPNILQVILTIAVRFVFQPNQAWDEDNSIVLEDEDEDFQGYEDEDEDEDSVL